MIVAVIIILVIAGFILFNWLSPYLEFKKIGTYDEYTPISKILHDKDVEYRFYQINGFKNINDLAMKYMRQVSESCTKKDLAWLIECREFLEAGLIKAGENDEAVFSIPEKIENVTFFDYLRAIKKSRISLPEHYQKMGCKTCGEAVVMHTWIVLRIMQIENGDAIKAHDMDYVIDTVKEMQKSAN